MRKTCDYLFCYADADDPSGLCYEHRGVLTEHVIRTTGVYIAADPDSNGAFRWWHQIGPNRVLRVLLYDTEPGTAPTLIKWLNEELGKVLNIEAGCSMTTPPNTSYLALDRDVGLKYAVKLKTIFLDYYDKPIRSRGQVIPVRLQPKELARL